MPRTHRDYVRAGKLGWARRQTKAARRSLAGVKSWKGRRSSAAQKRAEARARRSLASRLKNERGLERPEFTPEEIHSRIYDAAWAALTGETETALELAEEIVEGAEPGYMFAIRAEYVFPDGKVQWLSLSPLTPLKELGVALLAILEKSNSMLKTGQYPGAGFVEDDEVTKVSTELTDVGIHLTFGNFYWQ